MTGKLKLLRGVNELGSVYINPNAIVETQRIDHPPEHEIHDCIVFYQFGNEIREMRCRKWCICQVTEAVE